MNIKKLEKIVYVITILTIIFVAINSIDEGIEKEKTRYDRVQSNKEEFLYSNILHMGQFYLIEFEVSIGDCEGETELVNTITVSLNDEVQVNQTKRSHESSWICNTRDPEDISTVETTFRYTTPRLNVDTNLTIRGDILVNTKDFHVYRLRIYENYKGDGSSHFLIIIVIIMLVAMVLVFFAGFIEDVKNDLIDTRNKKIN